MTGDGEMALRLRGTRNPAIVDVARFQSFARFVGLTEAKTGRLVRRTIERASDTWRATAKDLPLSRERCARLDRWWRELALTRGASSPFESSSLFK